MVHKSEIEEKARQLQQALTETRQSAQNGAVIVAAVVVAAVVLAFVFGRRKGRKGSAIVEVYKV